MWLPGQQDRLEQIGKELEKLNLRSKDLTSTEWKQLEKLVEEGNDLWTVKKTHEAAMRLGGTKLMSPAEFGIDVNPGHFDNGPTFKGFTPNMQNQIRPTSMYEMDREQIAAIKQASMQGMPFKVSVGSKGIEHGEWGMRDKAAVTEGGLTPNLLPPIQSDQFWNLPYEISRISNFLPAQSMPGGGGVAYWQHSANAGTEASFVAEGASKPDLTPTVREVYLKSSKVAGLIKLTHELIMDTSDAFTSTLIQDLAASIYNAENAMILNGTVGANGWPGINQVTGTLTRAAAIGTTDYDALDVLSKAMNDLRVDFFVPDLIIIHPNSLSAIRRLRDVNKRLQLEMIQGAGNINQTSESEKLWGCNVIQTTQQAAGTAAVLSVQSGAAVLYIREGLTTFVDPYSLASTNVTQYIAETRIALASPRPQAINLVTGLPTS
jgi:HK97 family phage major capsid protein